MSSDIFDLSLTMCDEGKSLTTPILSSIFVFVPLKFVIDQPVDDTPPLLFTPQKKEFFTLPRIRKLNDERDFTTTVGRDASLPPLRISLHAIDSSYDAKEEIQFVLLQCADHGSPSTSTSVVPSSEVSESIECCWSWDDQLLFVLPEKRGETPKQIESNRLLPLLLPFFKSFLQAASPIFLASSSAFVLEFLHRGFSSSDFANTFFQALLSIPTVGSAWSIESVLIGISSFIYVRLLQTDRFLINLLSRVLPASATNALSPCLVVALQQIGKLYPRELCSTLCHLLCSDPKSKFSTQERLLLSSLPTQNRKEILGQLFAATLLTCPWDMIVERIVSFELVDCSLTALLQHLAEKSLIPITQGLSLTDLKLRISLKLLSYCALQQTLADVLLKEFFDALKFQSLSTGEAAGELLDVCCLCHEWCTTLRRKEPSLFLDPETLTKRVIDHLLLCMELDRFLTATHEWNKRKGQLDSESVMEIIYNKVLRATQPKRSVVFSLTKDFVSNNEKLLGWLIQFSWVSPPKGEKLGGDGRFALLQEYREAIRGFFFNKDYSLKTHFRLVTIRDILEWSFTLCLKRKSFVYSYDLFYFLKTVVGSKAERLLRNELEIIIKKEAEMACVILSSLLLKANRVSSSSSSSVGSSKGALRSHLVELEFTFKNSNLNLDTISKLITLEQWKDVFRFSSSFFESASHFTQISTPSKHWVALLENLPKETSPTEFFYSFVCRLSTEVKQLFSLDYDFQEAQNNLESVKFLQKSEAESWMPQLFEFLRNEEHHYSLLCWFLGAPESYFNLLEALFLRDKEFIDCFEESPEVEQLQSIWKSLSYQPDSVNTTSLWHSFRRKPLQLSTFLSWESLESACKVLGLLVFTNEHVELMVGVLKKKQELQILAERSKIEGQAIDFATLFSLIAGRSHQHKDSVKLSLLAILNEIVDKSRADGNKLRFDLGRFLEVLDTRLRYTSLRVTLDALQKLSPAKLERLVKRASNLQLVSGISKTEESLRTSEVHKALRLLQESMVVVRLSPTKNECSILLHPPKQKEDIGMDLETVNERLKISNLEQTAQGISNEDVQANVDLLLSFRSTINRLVEECAFGFVPNLMDSTMNKLGVFRLSELKSRRNRAQGYLEIWLAVKRSLMTCSTNVGESLLFGENTHRDALISRSIRQLCVAERAISTQPFDTVIHNSRLRPYLSGILEIDIRYEPPITKSLWEDSFSLEEDAKDEARMKWLIKEKLRFLALLLEQNQAKPYQINFQSKRDQLEERFQSSTVTILDFQVAGPCTFSPMDWLAVIALSSQFISKSTDRFWIPPKQNVFNCALVEEIDVLRMDEFSRFLFRALAISDPQNSEGSFFLLLFPDLLPASHRSELIRYLQKYGNTSSRHLFLCIVQPSSARNSPQITELREVTSLIGAHTEVMGTIQPSFFGIVEQTMAQILRSRSIDMYCVPSPVGSSGTGKSFAISSTVNSEKSFPICISDVTVLNDFTLKVRSQYSSFLWIEIISLEADVSRELATLIFNVLLWGEVVSTQSCARLRLDKGSKVFFEISLRGDFQHSQLSFLKFLPHLSCIPFPLDQRRLPNSWWKSSTTLATGLLPLIEAARHTERNLLALSTYSRYLDRAIRANSSPLPLECLRCYASYAFLTGRPNQERQLMDVVRFLAGDTSLDIPALVVLSKKSQWIVIYPEANAHHPSLTSDMKSSTATFIAIPPCSAMQAPCIVEGTLSEVTAFREVLRNTLLGDVLCLQPSKPEFGFEDFTLTTSMIVRMLIMHGTLSLGLPIILRGETGSGKSHLMRYFARLEGLPLEALDLHPEVSESEVVHFVSSKVHETPSVYFLDEVNCTKAASVVKAILSDRCVEGTYLADHHWLVAACNPTKEQGSSANYSVYQLPLTLERYVWTLGYDIGTLDFAEVAFERLSFVGNWAPELLIECNRFLTDFIEVRTADGLGPAPSSLREIDRIIQFYEFFNDLLSTTGKSRDVRVLPAVVLAVIATYLFRLPNTYRKELHKKIDEQLKRTLNISFSSSRLFEETCNTFLATNFRELDDYDIVLTQTIKQNLLMIHCHVTQRVPLFLVGESGTSKSLSIALYLDLVKNSNLPTVVERTLQCSSQLSASTLQSEFKALQEFSQLQSDKVGLIILEEIGLAESVAAVSSLKVLHSLLDSNYRLRKNQRVAFVALSNSYLDAAKMNRGNTIHLETSTKEEIMAFLEGSFQKHFGSALEQETLTTIATTLGEVCCQVLRLSIVVQKTNVVASHDRWFGMRDLFACLVEHRHYMSQMEGEITGISLWKNLCIAFLRHFGTSEHTNRLLLKTEAERIAKQLDPFVDCHNWWNGVCQKATPVGLLLERLKGRTDPHNLACKRHILLICDRQCVPFEATLVTGASKVLMMSAFCPPSTTLKDLDVIASSMKNGDIIVLNRRRDLYGAMYDVLNSHGLKKRQQLNRDETRTFRHLRLSLGATSKYFAQDESFLTVIIESSSNVSKLPYALLNRLQKIELSRFNWIEAMKGMVEEGDKRKRIEALQQVTIPTSFFLDSTSMISSFIFEDVGSDLKVLAEEAIEYGRPLEGLLEFLNHPMFTSRDKAEGILYCLSTYTSFDRNSFSKWIQEQRKERWCFLDLDTILPPGSLDDDDGVLCQQYDQMRIANAIEGEEDGEGKVVLFHTSSNKRCAQRIVSLMSTIQQHLVDDCTIIFLISSPVTFRCTRVQLLRIPYFHYFLIPNLFPACEGLSPAILAGLKSRNPDFFLKDWNRWTKEEFDPDLLSLLEGRLLLNDSFNTTLAKDLVYFSHPIPTGLLATFKVILQEVINDSFSQSLRPEDILKLSYRTLSTEDHVMMELRVLHESFDSLLNKVKEVLQSMSVQQRSISVSESEYQALRQGFAALTSSSTTIQGYVLSNYNVRLSMQDKLLPTGNHLLDFEGLRLSDLDRFEFFVWEQCKKYQVIQLSILEPNHVFFELCKTRPEALAISSTLGINISFQTNTYVLEGPRHSVEDGELPFRNHIKMLKEKLIGLVMVPMLDSISNSFCTDKMRLLSTPELLPFAHKISLITRFEEISEVCTQKLTEPTCFDWVQGKLPELSTEDLQLSIYNFLLKQDNEDLAKKWSARYRLPPFDPKKLVTVSPTWTIYQIEGERAEISKVAEVLRDRIPPIKMHGCQLMAVPGELEPKLKKLVGGFQEGRLIECKSFLFNIQELLWVRTIDAEILQKLQTQVIELYTIWQENKSNAMRPFLLEPRIPQPDGDVIELLPSNPPNSWQEFRFLQAAGIFWRFERQKQIVKIEWHRRPQLHQLYQQKQRHYGNPPEDWAWHGTSNLSNIASIMKNGFKIGGVDVPRTNGAARGVGVYLGVTASVSIPYDHTRSCLILARYLNHQLVFKNQQMIVVRESECVIPEYVVHYS